MDAKGEPIWHKHAARALLKQDILESMEGDNPVIPQTLWKSRPEYQEFQLSTFRSHIQQTRRYFRQFPGWQFSRNQEANTQYQQDVEQMRRGFESHGF